MPLASTTICRLEPSLPLSVGLGPVSWPAGAWHRGAIYAGSAPINLVMLAQTYQHGLVQTLPNVIGIPVTQAPPAGHTTAVTQGLRQVFPWDACLKHEQNAIKRCFIAHGELACTTFDGRCEGGDQGLQLSPQFFANGLSCHDIAALHQEREMTPWLLKKSTHRLR